METNQEKKDALGLLSQTGFGVLSTHSLDAPGYPFGSVVAYCLDEQGQPLLQLSAIAEHSKNISKNAKVSLTVTDAQGSGIQNSKRLTVIADAVKLENSDKRPQEIYFSHFPSSKSFQALDFSLYRLQIHKMRYIAGFGRAYWF